MKGILAAAALALVVLGWRRLLDESRWDWDWSESSPRR